MERRIQTPSKFLFPNLETLYWYAAKNLSYSLQGTVRWEIILTSRTIEKDLSICLLSAKFILTMDVGMVWYLFS